MSANVCSALSVAEGEFMLLGSGLDTANHCGSNKSTGWNRPMSFFHRFKKNTAVGGVACGVFLFPKLYRIIVSVVHEFVVHRQTRCFHVGKKQIAGSVRCIDQVQRLSAI